MLLGSMDSCLPPKGDRASLRRPLRQLSLGQEPLPASPLISTRNLVPGLSESVVQLDMLGKGGWCFARTRESKSVSLWPLSVFLNLPTQQPAAASAALTSESPKGKT